MEARVRRRSDPLICQYLWDAITTIRNHKQLPSFDRIRRYMNRTHSMESDKVEKHLEECTADNLIVISRKVGQKGSKVGVEQEGFRLPVPPEEPDSHDWYCFECHQGGEVVSCSKCYRVFHTRCLNSQEYTYPQEMFVCPVCQKRLFQRTSGRCRIAREELNALLAYAVAKLKKRLPINLMERVVSAPAQKNNFTGDRVQSPRQEQNTGTVVVAEPFRAQILLHHQMDLHSMEQKTQDRRYKTPYDFEIDAATIVHNAVIFHGSQSTAAEMSLLVLRDCKHDLIEIELCTDCYRYAQDEEDQFWFCKPCNPPHELVYVKQKGFPYWPAKVMKIENDVYDVRFFGSQHQRANVEKSTIKPITTNVNPLQSKRTSAWVKACEELKKHQEMLELPRHPPPPPMNHQIPPAYAHPYHHIQSVHQPPHETQRFFAQPFAPHFQPTQHCFSPHQPLIHAWGAPVHPSMSPRPIPGGLVPRAPAGIHPSQIPPPTLATSMPPPLPQTSQTTSPQKKDSTVQTQKSPRTSTKRSEPAIDTPKANKQSATSKAKVETATQESSEPDQGPSSSSSSVVPKNEATASDDMVTSSSQEHSTETIGVQTSPRLFKKFVDELAESKKQKEVAAINEKKDQEVKKNKTAQMTIKNLEKDMEKVKEEHSTQIVSMQENHKRTISETKRKQWCWTCENEAIYHCCWNTAYCSIECQQKHWKSEHKKMCRRKR